MIFYVKEVKISISYLFVALLTFALINDRAGLVLPTLMAIAVHECGHIIAMCVLSCRISEINLVPGSVKIIREACYDRRKEILILSAGPISNIMMFVAFFLISEVFPGRPFELCAASQAVVFILNILPARGLDGGAILNNILLYRFTVNTTDRILLTLSLILCFSLLLFAVVLIACGSVNISLFILATYIFIFTIIKI